MRWAVADLGFCGGFERKGWSFFFFFWIKSLVGVVSLWVDKNWCFVDSIFSWFTVCLRVLQISVVDLVIRKG